MYWLVVAILMLAVFVAMKVHELARVQIVLTQFMETQFKELQEATRSKEPASVAYGWFDDGFPASGSDGEESAPIENPTLESLQDQFSTQMWIAEYRSLPSPRQRVAFLRALRREWAWLKPELLDVVFADESAFVRAWAGGHLDLHVTDYTDHQNPVEIRNYQTGLLGDAESIVRASVWSNRECRTLP